LVTSDILLKIYLKVTERKVEYPPSRKHYNHHLYG